MTSLGLQLLGIGLDKRATRTQRYRLGYTTSAFAWQRSRVRVSSGPLLEYVALQEKRCIEKKSPVRS